MSDKLFQKMCLDTSVPLNYYTVFHHIQEIIPKGIKEKKRKVLVVYEKIKKNTVKYNSFQML